MRPRLRQLSGNHVEIISLIFFRFGTPVNHYPRPTLPISTNSHYCSAEWLLYSVLDNWQCALLPPEAEPCADIIAFQEVNVHAGDFQLYVHLFYVNVRVYALHNKSLKFLLHYGVASFCLPCTMTFFWALVYLVYWRNHRWWEALWASELAVQSDYKSITWLLLNKGYHGKLVMKHPSLTLELMNKHFISVSLDPYIGLFCWLYSIFSLYICVAYGLNFTYYWFI